jgi:hypothetical protein
LSTHGYRSYDAAMLEAHRAVQRVLQRRALPLFAND